MCQKIFLEVPYFYDPPPLLPSGDLESFNVGNQEWLKYSSEFIGSTADEGWTAILLSGEDGNNGGQKRKTGQAPSAHNVADEHIQQDDEAEGCKHKTGQAGKAQRRVAEAGDQRERVVHQLSEAVI